MSTCSTERVKRFIERQTTAGKKPTTVYLAGSAKQFLRSFPRPLSHGVVIERALLNLAADDEVMRRWFPELRERAVLNESA
jgi:hypothetical protein